MWPFAWQNLITRPSRTALAAIGLTIPESFLLRVDEVIE